MSRPWMPLYVADYRADTAHLSSAEHGAYLLLIMHYWQTGSIPTEDAQLARIACMTAHEWKKARAVIAAFFLDGWRHKRIDDELVRALEISNKRRASVNQRYNKTDTIEPTNVEQVKTHARGLPPSQLQEEKKEATGSSEPVRSKLKYPAAFEGWWLAYPRTPVMSKKEAIAAWNRLSEPDRLLAVSALPKYAAFLKSHPDHPVVHACRFLSQRRFDGFDEAQGPAPEGAPPGFYAAFGAPELDAWDAYRMDFEGRKYPRDKRGGWSFPTRWPTGYEVKNGHGAHNGTGGAQEGTTGLFGGESVPCDRSDASGQPAAPASLARAFTIE